jgi:CubicO group peptidase (beta-lactamase class C family)
MNPNQFHQIIASLEAARDEGNQPLKMDSLMITKGNDTFVHHWSARHKMKDLRSLTKPILCMALGIALENGLNLRGERIDLNTRIWPFLEDRVKITNCRNAPLLKKVTLRHLLTHTIGFDHGFMFREDVKQRDQNSLLEYIFNTSIVHEPGAHFVYSNTGPYIISAWIQNELGIDLASWIAPLLFDPLFISEFSWNKYGPYRAGCTGLHLSHEDLHKLGKLFLTGGVHNGKQVVPFRWLDSMKTLHIERPVTFQGAPALPKYGYGFYLWLCESGTFYCDGTDGQYLIVIPHKNTLITTFGNQPDMKPITECFRPLL